MMHTLDSKQIEYLEDVRRSHGEATEGTIRGLLDPGGGSSSVPLDQIALWIADDRVRALKDLARAEELLAQQKLDQSISQRLRRLLDEVCRMEQDIDRLKAEFVMTTDAKKARRIIAHA